MYAKAIYRDQIHLIKLRPINSIIELKTIITYTFNRLSADYVLKFENSYGGYHVVTDDEDVNLMKNRSYNIIKLIIEDNNN
jgi:hypothetical protein